MINQENICVKFYCRHCLVLNKVDINTNFVLQADWSILPSSSQEHLDFYILCVIIFILVWIKS